MTRIYLILLFIASQYLAISQTIAVKSFTKLPNDMDARVNFPIKDANGETCALIKVVTGETGFSFDGGSVGVWKTEKKTGEWWVYVMRGTKYLTILHDKLGVLRNWPYPEPIEQATVYEMVLTTGTVTTIVEDQILSQWLVITTEPADAQIYLNDQFEATGTLQKKLKPGKYTYRAEASLYHNEAGIVELTADKKQNLTLKLKPNYGFLKIATLPESGAKIKIDGLDATGVTPLTTDKLKSGEHTVTAILAMYQPTTQKVTVSDGLTTPINLTMLPTFATLELTAASDANLYVNDRLKGQGSWKGRLDAGVYTLEARKDKYRTAKQDIELAAGDTRTLMLTPLAINGSLDVLTNPPDATILLNNKDYGTSPNTIGKLLIGEYTLTLQKAGYGTITKTITVTENATTEVNETLPSGIAVTLTSTPAGASVYVDGVSAGSTPINTTLSFGIHTIKLINGKKEVTEIITVSQGGKTNWSFDVSETKNSFVDARDGHTYKTIKIGNQVWMAENLAYKTTDGCWAYDNSSSNVAKYGYLYYWETAKKVCPSGWHLPTKEEFETLLTNVGGSGNAAYKPLIEGGNSGFSAPFGGYRYDSGAFISMGSIAYFWSSTAYNTYNAWYLDIYSNYKKAYLYFNGQSAGFSVRCLQDY